MSRLAAILARVAWFWMLWYMRRPGIKRLQRLAMSWGSPARQAASRKSILGQNRIARRFGLPILTFTFNLLLASIILTGIFQLCLWMFDSGVLTMPDNLRERVESGR